MTQRAAFDISHTAVLAMDCQAGIVSVYAKPPEEFAARVAAVLGAARSAGMTVIHVRVGFRFGLPEASDRNKLFVAIKSSPEHQKFFEGASGAIHPALSPEEGDVVVTKHRVSAFKGTDLDVLLSAKEVDTLVLFGIATSGVVLATLLQLQAADADCRLCVIADCCADTDAGLPDALIERFFPKFADVMTSQAFMESLG